MFDDFFRDEEIETIKRTKLEYSGEEYTEEELNKILNWAKNIFVALSTIDLAVSGELVITWDHFNDEPLFSLNKNNIKNERKSFLKDKINDFEINED